MVSLPAEFRARLESYSGPLDLLLYLIKKEEVDIFDIPIARILEQYRVYLEILRDIDPNACGEFLVMAARLMEIKSKLLLPREVLEVEEEYEDPRIELVRQLIEYKRYKERALLLERRFAEYSQRHRRPPPEPSWLAEGEEDPLEIGNVSIWELFTAYHRVELMLAQRMPLEVVVRERPVEEYMGEVVASLENAPKRTLLFEELFAGARSRQDAIGYFLAILELAKDGRLLLHQDELFGPITVTLREDAPGRVEDAQAEGEGGSEGEDMEPAAVHLLRGEGPEAALEPLRPKEAGTAAGGPVEPRGPGGGGAEPRAAAEPLRPDAAGEGAEARGRPPGGEEAGGAEPAGRRDRKDAEEREEPETT